MIYTVFFNNDEMPQDFATKEDAENYGQEIVTEGFADSYTIESTTGEIV